MEQVNTPMLELQVLVEDRQALLIEKKQIEEAVETLNQSIKKELNALGVDEVEAGDFKVVLSVRERSTLDKTELISQGVTTEQIKRATKVSTYIQLDVREKK